MFFGLIIFTVKNQFVCILIPHRVATTVGTDPGHIMHIIEMTHWIPMMPPSGHQERICGEKLIAQSIDFFIRQVRFPNSSKFYNQIIVQSKMALKMDGLIIMFSRKLSQEGQSRYPRYTLVKVELTRRNISQKGRQHLSTIIICTKRKMYILILTMQACQPVGAITYCGGKTIV